MPYKLFGKLEAHLGKIERSDDLDATIDAMVRTLVEDFESDLGLQRGRHYVRRGDELVLRGEFPETDAHRGFRIPVSYAPIRDLLRDGFVYREPRHPELDPRIEDPLGVGSFAAIRVGDTDVPHVIAFSLRDHDHPDQVVFTLNTIRHVLDVVLRKRRLENRVAQTRAIQQSLLPRRAPEFAGYDIWGATRPAEEVGGDVYDFIPVSVRSLAVVIADAAGHGLPAALQARDAIIGLRMGVEDRMRITATVEKLNQVITHSALSSKFISMFYGEIEPNGNLVFCNAGHNPPILHQRGELSELRRGGMVLGALPDARYERGYVQLEVGSALLLYTDGIIETPAPGSEREMLGLEPVREILAGRGEMTAREIVDAVFEAARRFGRTQTPADDQTVVAVRRISEIDPVRY